MGLNTLRLRQDGHHFADNIFTCIFFNENCCILIKILLKCVCSAPIDNNPALVQIMAWRRSGDKPLSEPMMDNLPMHICITRPQWVKPNQAITVQLDVDTLFIQTWIETLNSYKHLLCICIYIYIYMYQSICKCNADNKRFSHLIFKISLSVGNFYQILFISQIATIIWCYRKILPLQTFHVVSKAV